MSHAKRCAWLGVLALSACPEDSGPKVVPLPEQSVARLVSMGGTVSLTRAGKKGPASPGALLERDELDTGEASKALVRAPGGREIELGESTHFKVGKSLGDIEVTEGTISFLAPDEGDGGVVSVTTRYGRTNIEPGARATLALKEGRLAVEVSVGVITQLEDDGGVRQAGAGQKLEISIGAIEVVDPGTTPEPKVLEVQLLAEGRVLLKKKGDAKFAPAKKGVQPVAEGTAFQVAAGGKARLGVAGVSVRVPGAANGAIDSAAPGDDGNALGVQVNGPAQVALDGKTPAAVTFGGKSPLKVKGMGEASLTVNKQRVDVHLGEVELTVNGKTKTVKAGEVASVTGAGVEVASRVRPMLVVPMGKRVRVYARRLGEVGLGLPDEPLRTQVAQDPSFTEVMLSGPSKDFVSVAAPPTGELYWRTLDDKGDVTATGKVRFLPDTTLKDEKERSDVVAETGLKATVFFQSSVPTLTFTFPQGEGAKGYKFKVYRSSDLKTAMLEKKATENKVTVEPGVLTEGSYVWFASPLDAAGNEMGGGRMNKMDIIYDNSLTTLQISSPRDGERAEGAKAAGTAPLGSKLFINGKAVGLDSSGRFETALGRAETVTFRLVSSDGSESYWLRRLRR